MVVSNSEKQSYLARIPGNIWVHMACDELGGSPIDVDT
jgi:hypothetical protein